VDEDALVELLGHERLEGRVRRRKIGDAAEHLDCSS
jgi:hypothetical protein